MRRELLNKLDTTTDTETEPALVLTPAEITLMADGDAIAAHQANIDQVDGPQVIFRKFPNLHVYLRRRAQIRTNGTVVIP